MLSQPLQSRFNIKEGQEVIIESGRLARQADGSVTVRQGNCIILATVVANKEPKESEESNCWYAANRNTALELTPSFEGSFGVNGWQQLGKTLLQWGLNKTDQAGFVYINFPREFPEAFTGIYAMHEGGGPAIPIEYITSRTNRGVTLRVTNHNEQTDGGWTMRWFATGY